MADGTNSSGPRVINNTNSTISVQPFIFPASQTRFTIQTYTASIQAGNIYASMEATIPKPVEDIDSTQVAIFNIFKFLEEELPIFAYEKQYDHMQDEQNTNPDSQNSTELGEVPHKEKKGVLGQAVQSPQYAYNYMYFGE